MELTPIVKPSGWCYCTTLAAKLAETAVRNTAGAVGDRIEILTACKKDKDTILN